MRNLRDIWLACQSKTGRWRSDKGDVHSYIDVYAELLAPYRARPVVVLEIGILNGDSLRMWEEYFEHGVVYGVDLNDHPLDMADLRPMIAEGTHHIVLMNAADQAQVESHFGDKQFDVIIEDTSHSLPDQLAIYANFRHKLAPGGVYVIEDVEDIDASRETFARLDPDRSVSILDRRRIKGRFDDVLVIIKNS